MPADEKAEVFFIIVKRLLKWAAYAAGLAVSVTALIVGGVLLYEKWGNRPILVTKLHEISIGDKHSDVEFRFGIAKKIGDAKDDAAGEDTYHVPETRLAFGIRDGKVQSIRYLCSNKSADYTSVNGVSCGQSGDDILQRYPGKVRVQCPLKPTDENRLERVFDAVEYGVRYGATMNRVDEIIVVPPGLLQGFSGVNWGECK